MKISRKVWLIIGIAIFVIALVSLVRIYSQQVREQEQLSVSLAAQQALLRGLTVSKNETEKQLAQAESLFNTSQVKFPKALESIEYGEDFFKIAYGQNLYAMADGCGVSLTSLTASQPTDKTAGTVTYSVASFAVQVEGDIDDILKFIDAIGTGIDYKLPWSFQLPWSVDVKSVSMEISEEGATATINMDIYGYKG
jgi:type II secretory pathway pseudopilin PulG